MPVQQSPEIVAVHSSRDEHLAQYRLRGVEVLGAGRYPLTKMIWMIHQHRHIPRRYTQQVLGPPRAVCRTPTDRRTAIDESHAKVPVAETDRINGREPAQNPPPITLIVCITFSVE